MDDVQAHLRVLPKELLSQGWEDPRNHDLRATNSQLASVGVGQGLKLSYALSQLVENAHPALEQGLAIRRQFDALRAAIKQAHAQVVFEVGDRLGGEAMRDGEASSGLGHAARRGHSQQDVKMPESGLAPDAVRPMHKLTLRRLAAGMSANGGFRPTA